MNDYKIGKLYEEMELELIKSMKKNFNRHLKEESKTGFEFPQWQAEKLKELKRYQRQNVNIIGSYTKGLDKEISIHLQEELKQGSMNAIKKHNQVLGTDLKQDAVMNQSFFKTNDKKVNALIKSVNNDLKKANNSALRMINDQYRQTIHKSAFFLANGTISPQKAIDMATKDFLSRGINCIEYKDGRRVNIASYSQMAIRTASLRAQLMGDGDFRKSIGRTLVVGTASNVACPQCSKWENTVMIDDIYSGGSRKDGNYPLLSEAMEEGFLHPNCRDGVSTYYPEIEDIDKSYEDGKDGSESDESYQEDLNYINQKIKQYIRLENGSLDEENISNYKRKKAEWENKRKMIENSKLNKEDVSNLINKSKEIMGDNFSNKFKGVKISVNGEENRSFYRKSEDRIYLSNNADEYTIIHEIGHKYYYDYNLENNKTYQKILKNKFSKYTRDDFEEVKGSKSSYYLLKNSSEFVSKYQTRIYKGNRSSFTVFGKVKERQAREYLSEGLKYYFKEPNKLYNIDKPLYNFIDKIVKGK